MSTRLTPSFLSQLLGLDESQLAPNWYDTGAAKSRKRKGAGSTSQQEKKKKAATVVVAEDDTAGLNIPQGR